MDALYLPNVVSNRPYATSTPAASDPTQAWAMLYQTPDSLARTVDKSTLFGVRLVRGGSPLQMP
jgi:hypothetical protein